jgi:monofunctional biosynthetic peptidoglycan transglycosylase
MELIWGKKRILEIYLNIIAFGDGIYGVEAASLYYFKKSYSDLSIKQAYWLASIMSSPRKLAPNRRIINPMLRMRAEFLSQSAFE